MTKPGKPTAGPDDAWIDRVVAQYLKESPCGVALGTVEQRREKVRRKLQQLYGHEPRTMCTDRAIRESLSHVIQMAMIAAYAEAISDRP